ncbi:MAG: hypothetical protein KGN79_11945, partial [Acidobacteriota bacterium]|nr:hypothetical protein [Acidobacteriota bacterium]
LYGVALAVAAGAMLKGPAILVAPFAIAVDAFFWRKALSGIRARHWTGALAVTLLVVGPWHMAILAAHGGAFFREYFIQQIVHRTDSVIDASTGGPLYYAVALVHGAFPWSILAAFSVARLFWLRKRLPAGSKQLRTQSVDPLFWSLIAVTLVLYTLVSTKHAWYIAPVFPALAIESGRLLAELLPRHQRLRLGVAAVLAFALVFTFARVAVRQGDHSSNEIAQMAMLTRTAESHSASPLLVLAGAGENTQADVPTVVFYSHRTATSIVLPQSTESLAIALASNGGREAILSNETIPALSNCCTIHAFAHNELFTYARISLTHTSKRP